MKGFFKLISSTEFTRFFDRFKPLASEQVNLAEAHRRTVSQDITSAENLPPFSRSTMDGYAVRARDTFGCSESEPALLSVIGEISMGSSGKQYTLQPGQTVRIWTGGELPQKGDSVVMVEYSQPLDEKTIEIFRPVAPAENTIQTGEDYSTGEPVIKQGKLLRPAELGVLAGLGITSVPVHRKPQVAIISTGDELVPPDHPPGPGQIRDINSTTIAALVEEAGGVPSFHGIIGDDLEAMTAACNNGLKEADIVILSGGSSVGKRDFTLQVFEQIQGTELLAHGVSIRPGKPTILAQCGNKALFGLPGHAASAMVVFYLFVRPLLSKFNGLPCDLHLHPIKAITDQQIPSVIGREEYVRVSLSRQENGKPPLATPLYGKSGLLKPLVKADGLLCIGRDVEGVDKDTEQTVLLFP